MPDADDAPAASLSERAYRSVLADILAGRLAAGAIIQERRLAAGIGVSRSPLRDALGRLEGAGLLVRRPGGALTVRAVSLEEYLQSLDLRALVEPTAAALACRAIAPADLARLDRKLSRIEADDEPAPESVWDFDDDLHETVARASRNPFIAETLAEMHRYTVIYERQRGSGRLKPGTRDHRDILAALAARDEDAAREATLRHLRRIRRRMLAQF
ncbi:HTH-type transcriptional repressor RspR [Methylobacterium crusticola]|uniref:HTH-type transcriptional repressor RspR n=1 Tax=Methylobacterium crusticola TaxID=1697972 RepID=A0ABQ4QY57_9HYPH|nr:GntR family transcriptional regulator [Methylobacterium crusticola]GJD49609.1 HTH-type transcriptional repressor RspR [Methylobacterium crusticola]